MEKTSKLIKITVSCKERLERAKGIATFSDFISDMLSYFEMIKLDPKTAISNPTTEVILHIDRAKDMVIKRMEDVIKIIRNIETTKLANISERVAGVESLLLTDSTGLSIEQIQEVVNENQRLHMIRSVREQQKNAKEKLAAEVSEQEAEKPAKSRKTPLAKAAPKKEKQPAGGLPEDEWNFGDEFKF